MAAATAGCCAASLASCRQRRGLPHAVAKSRAGERAASREHHASSTQHTARCRAPRSAGSAARRSDAGSARPWPRGARGHAVRDARKRRPASEPSPEAPCALQTQLPLCNSTPPRRQCSLRRFPQKSEAASVRANRGSHAMLHLRRDSLPREPQHPNQPPATAIAPVRSTRRSAGAPGSARSPGQRDEASRRAASAPPQQLGCRMRATPMRVAGGSCVACPAERMEAGSW
jgi:hypothetical protein